MTTVNHLKDHIGYWLSRLALVVRNAFEQRLAQHGITSAEWNVLLTVYNQHAASVSECAKFIEIDKASISRIVNRLTEKKLIIHNQGTDRRCGHLFLTDKASALVPKLINCALENEQQFFSCLSIDELKSLQKIMHKLALQTKIMAIEGWLTADK